MIEFEIPLFDVLLFVVDCKTTGIFQYGNIQILKYFNILYN